MISWYVYFYLLQNGLCSFVNCKKGVVLMVNIVLIFKFMIRLRVLWIRYFRFWGYVEFQIFEVCDLKIIVYEKNKVKVWFMVL